MLVRVEALELEQAQVVVASELQAVAALEQQGAEWVVVAVHLISAPLLLFPAVLAPPRPFRAWAECR